MSTITTKDGTRISYRDRGKGPIVTFSHGWPLSSDAWTARCVCSRRRASVSLRTIGACHGLSSSTFAGNGTDGYADDLAAVIEALDLRDRRERAAHASA